MEFDPHVTGTATIRACRPSPAAPGFDPGAAGTALVSWPYRMEVDPHAAGSSVFVVRCAVALR
jgi:hypothetical protein